MLLIRTHLKCLICENHSQYNDFERLTLNCLKATKTFLEYASFQECSLIKDYKKSEIDSRLSITNY